MSLSRISQFIVAASAAVLASVGTLAAGPTAEDCQRVVDEAYAKF